jgi:hypothetical protein
VILDRLRGDRNDERAGGDSLCLPIGNEAQRDGSLGHDVGELASGIDQLVELQVK